MSTKCLFRAIKAKVGSAQRKLVLITLCDIANEKGQCWPSHQYIADRAECSRRSVITHLASLEESGFISIAQRSKDNIKTSNIYTILNVQELHNDVQEFHKGSETVAQGGSETVAHNTPTLSTPLIDTSKPSKPKRPLTEDFQVTARMLNWVSEKNYGHIDLIDETDRFIDHWQGKGEARADWVATWRQWIRNADKFQRKAKENGGKRDGISAAIHGN